MSIYLIVYLFDTKYAWTIFCPFSKPHRQLKCLVSLLFIFLTVLLIMRVTYSYKFRIKNAILKYQRWNTSIFKILRTKKIVFIGINDSTFHLNNWVNYQRRLMFSYIMVWLRATISTWHITWFFFFGNGDDGKVCVVKTTLKKNL